MTTTRNGVRSLLKQWRKRVGKTEKGVGRGGNEAGR